MNSTLVNLAFLLVAALVGLSSQSLIWAISIMVVVIYTGVLRLRPIFTYVISSYFASVISSREISGDLIGYEAWYTGIALGFGSINPNAPFFSILGIVGNWFNIEFRAFLFIISYISCVLILSAIIQFSNDARSRRQSLLVAAPILLLPQTIDNGGQFLRQFFAFSVFIYSISLFVSGSAVSTTRNRITLPILLSSLSLASHPAVLSNIIISSGLFLRQKLLVALPVIGLGAYLTIDLLDYAFTRLVQFDFFSLTPLSNLAVLYAIAAGAIALLGWNLGRLRPILIINILSLVVAILGGHVYGFTEVSVRLHFGLQLFVVVGCALALPRINFSFWPLILVLPTLIMMTFAQSLMASAHWTYSMTVPAF